MKTFKELDMKSNMKFVLPSRRRLHVVAQASLLVLGCIGLALPALAALAVLPRCVGDQLRGLKLADLGQQPPGRDVWAGYHKDLKRSPRLRALLATTLEALAQHE